MFVQIGIRTMVRPHVLYNIDCVGSVAELLLRHLEQMVSSSLVSNQGESEASILQNQNYQLRR